MALATATVFILQHKTVAVACVYAAGVAILGIFGYMLRNVDPAFFLGGVTLFTWGTAQ